jgi:hypothetical protein
MPSFRSVRGIGASLLILSTLAAWSATADAATTAEPQSERLKACSRLDDRDRRLDCFDHEVAEAEKQAARRNRSPAATRAGAVGAAPAAAKPSAQVVSEVDVRAAFDKGRTLAAADGLTKFDIAGKPLDRIADPCSQRFFVRADPLDNHFYAVNAGVGNAKGASVSYTNNQLAGSQSVTLNGLVSYVLTDSACIDNPIPLSPYISGFALAPWVSANGTLNEPQKTGEQSALRSGFDIQIEAAQTGFFDLQSFSVSPYVQTDFRGIARVQGVDLAWEPVQHLILLGQGRPLNDYIGGFWQLRAEADFYRVEERGLTNLTPGRHAWMGGTARANIYLFPIASEHAWPSWLLNRVSLVGTAQFFRDTETGKNIQYYSAAFQYALSSSVNISFEYDRGTTKETLVDVNQYLFKLNYKQ